MTKTLVLLVDDEALNLLDKLAGVARPKFLVINKIDLVLREKLLALVAAVNAKMPFEETFMVSALSGDGVEHLRAQLAARLPPGPFLYPEDQMSDAPMRQLAAEITREKIYAKLHQEIPYQSTVETESWKDARGGGVRIEQTIYVERERQQRGRQQALHGVPSAASSEVEPAATLGTGSAPKIALAPGAEPVFAAAAGPLRPGPQEQRRAGSGGGGHACAAAAGAGHGSGACRGRV